MIKICKHCNLSLNYNYFYKNKTAKDGYRNICKTCFCDSKLSYYQKNNKEIRLKKDLYRKDNVEKVRFSTNKYYSKRLKTDDLFKLSHNLRSLLNKSLKRGNTSKHTKTISTLGCSFEDFKVYIEKQFTSDLTWNNYGPYWSIDHICPCNQAQNEEELTKLQHYINLRPMKTFGYGGNIHKSDNKTKEAQDLCIKLLNRNWIE